MNADMENEIKKTERVCEAKVCRAKVLPLLFQMSQLIGNSKDLGRTTEIMLHIMERYLGTTRGMITLFNQSSGEIFIHKSIGMTQEEEERGVYRLGEGITGKVVESGRSIVVPIISQEKDFLNRTRAGRHSDSGKEYSFICVPIMRGKKVLGTISMERVFDNPASLEQDVEILGILAVMIAQELELYMLEQVEQPALEEQNRRLTAELKARYRPENMIGNSKPMQEVFALIDKIAPARTTVLLLGESGVGKELVASAIHYRSNISNGPFIKFNCAALPEALIESELFGHEKGSFTGATGLRKGRFEDANKGTIFLDEVGELSLGMQAKLLRVLQERSFERVGGNQTIQVDIRIIAATNRDLQVMVDKGEFRSDLFYRLNVFPILIPPLRERGIDVIALADHFVQKFSSSNDRGVRRLSTPAIDMLLRYHWPGNVRELENVVERAVILSEDEVIHGYHLPPSLQTADHSETRVNGPLDSMLDRLEYEMIVEALKETRGNMSDAARKLGLTKRVMGLRMAKFDLDYRGFRAKANQD